MHAAQWNQIKRAKVKKISRVFVDGNSEATIIGPTTVFVMLSEKRQLMRKYISVLLAILALPCAALVSTNVPLDHWSYDAIDKLIGQGLIDSSMITTRPVSRFEMARHIAEADEKFQRLNSSNEIIAGILERLKKEFEPELATTGAVEGKPILDFAKPIEDPYIKYMYAHSTPDIENIRGDTFDKYSNLRAGFAARAQLFDIAAFYAHPEYPWSSENDSQDVKLIEGYGKLMLGNLEVEIGKDSMWWGPGYHGSMLMSNNAEPFKMVKLSNPTPISLPWIFRAFGPLKVVWFLTQLEEDRPVPKPNLTGMRINFKPLPAVELGVSRAIIFGGEGRPEYSFGDYCKAFFGRNESLSGQKENDQLAGFDASVLLPVDWLMPAKSVKLYIDWAGEDEAGALPAKWGRLYGIKFFDIFKTGKTDLDIEYANDHVSGSPDVFYTHGLFTPGYTYKDRTIGHFMGTDSEDLFFRLTHYLNKDVILGLQYDTEKSNLSSNPQPRTDRVQSDITLFTTKSWQMNAGYRYELTKNSPLPDNHIVFMQLIYDF
jgi:hypothetical protein